MCALTVVTGCAGGTGNPMTMIRALGAGSSADLQPETIPAADSSAMQYAHA